MKNPTDVEHELQRLLGTAERGDPMKFEDYVRFCRSWVPLYLNVWYWPCWNEDSVKKELAKYRPIFWNRVEQVERDCSSFEDFSDIGSGQLVLMYQMISLAQVGLRMASDICKVNAQDAIAVYIETLFRDGLLVFLLKKQDPCITLHWWFWLSMYTPVIRELERRGSKHIGFPAGLYKLLSTIEEWSGVFGILDEAISRRMDGFVKKVPLSITAFETLKNRECNSSTKLTKDEIRSQAAVTLGERWNDDSFYALRDSLDGKLNIVPRAIKDDIIDQLRKGEIREDRIKLHLNLREEDGPDKEDPAIKIEAKTAKVYLQEEAQDRQREKFADMQQEVVNRWAAGSQRKKRFIQGLKEGRTLKLIAKELEIHPNTATNWKKDLSEMLQMLRS